MARSLPVSLMYVCVTPINSTSISLLSLVSGAETVVYKETGMLRRRGGAPRSLQHTTGALRYDLVDSLNRFAPTVVVQFGIGASVPPEINRPVKATR